MDEKNQIIVMKTMRQPNMTNNMVTSPSRVLSIRKDSMAMLSKPKIRVIHVFAPEIIKTDTANFRDLVQRLTGKPADDHSYSHKRKKNKVAMTREVPEPRLVVPEKPKPRKAEQFDVFWDLGTQERLIVAAKEEQGGNYLKDFADLDDGFMHELRGYQLDGFMHELRGYQLDGFMHELRGYQSAPHIVAPQHIPYFDATTI